MLRMALRGLLARKLRTALTGFAVVIGVAFVSGTFIFTDTINASFTDLFERVSKGVDVNVTAKQPVEGDFGGRIQPLPPGTLEKVEAAPRRRGGRAALRDEVSIFDDEGERDRRQRPAVDRVLDATRSASTPCTYVEGGPAERARRGDARRGHRRQGAASRSATSS